MFQLFRLIGFLLILSFNLTTSVAGIRPATPLYQVVALSDTLRAHHTTPVQIDSISGDSTEHHEITLFAMPTMLPLDWTSPSSLYKSMLQVYLKTFSLKDNYLLGHVAVRLKSPMLDQPLYTAQSSKKWQERIDLVLKQRVGFGILGASLEGRIEPSDEIKHKLAVYRERNKLAFITLRVNKTAMQRMLTFYNEYQRKITDDYAPSDFYGGAFWPRYYNEGAGCAAFAFSMLDLGNLIPPEADQWKIEVKIPMNIIGGEFNKGKKIKNRTIKHTTSWYDGDGVKNIDYADYFVWDPAYIFDWVVKQHADTLNSDYQLVRENGVPGLYKDARKVQVDANEPIFMQRPDENLFIDHYYQRLHLEKK